MRPSPFTGKFKRREPKENPLLEKQNDEQEAAEDSKGVAKMPTFGIGKKSKEGKQTKKIYDALRDPEQEQSKEEEKPIISMRPSMKFKGDKKVKIFDRHGSKERVTEPADDPEEIKKPFLKPNLFQKDKRKEINEGYKQEEVIVETEKEENPSFNEEQSSEQSISQSLSLGPKLKTKSRAQQPIIEEESNKEAGSGGVSSFGNMKIETRELNLNTEEGKVSEVKLEKQKARARDLRSLLNLQIDLFEETLSIACVTPYQIYINKIKGGSLKNSYDQSFDEKNVVSCQTHSLEFDDFTNQCPQDYHTDVTSIVQDDETEALNRFFEKVTPVLEELIKPSSSIAMPPIFLLALRPEFEKFLICPYPLFVYHSELIGAGIIVIGEKLFITQGRIVSVLSLGNYLVGGCGDGTIHLWTGRNARGSRLYKKVYSLIESTNFELPEYDTNQLDRFSVYRTDSSIVSLHSCSPDEFYSLDSSCKMVRWQIQTLYGSRTQLRPLSSVEFLNLVQRPSMIATGLHRRNDTLFIGTSSGILVWASEEVSQKLDTDEFAVVEFALPHRSNFVYAICEDSSIRIFDQNYSNCLMKVCLPEGDPPVHIHVPETEYENKKLSITNRIYVTTQGGKVHAFNILKDRSQGTLIWENQDQDRNVIYNGINILGQAFEAVSLWRDLKCSTKRHPTDVNLEASVRNMKAILEENRRVHALMEAETGLSLV